MYAVIKTGGKQYKVAEGQTLKIEKLPALAGEKIEFNDVLMLIDGDKISIGSPFLANAKVSAEVVAEGRHDKIRIIKFRRRKHYRKRQGHRQWFTEVKIGKISA